MDTDILCSYKVIATPQLDFVSAKYQHIYYYYNWIRQLRENSEERTCWESRQVMNDCA